MKENLDEKQSDQHSHFGRSHNLDLHSVIHTHKVYGASVRLSEQQINISTKLLDSTSEATDEADLERIELVAQLIKALDDVVEVVLEGSNTITVIRVSDVKFSGHAND